MKKVDIRNIYECEILKQTKVIKIQDNNIVFGHDPYYSWTYEEDQSQLGLFVRVLGGYKHIVTDTIYPKPSKKTGNKHVINPDNIERFVIKERELANHLIEKYQSYDMDIGVIKALEERINDDHNFELEDDDGRDQ